MKTKKTFILTIIVLFGIMGATIFYRHDISYKQICCIKNPDSKDNVKSILCPIHMASHCCMTAFLFNHTVP